ncbi:sugar ABC transporter permease [Aeromicrobium ginsengisoli]|uniref:Xylose transport system permease protein XylH n=1 Tax=Aeromicrobium ginsengisoli TaxID=363867 RepID=A0A5M4FJV1_9ACTN|nr:inner-membrane translocator [Aeromicrobium ginsengisoli]KAA1399885.1 inner-membrane translocator [Aeromicrobium ginsengisoli]
MSVSATSRTPLAGRITAAFEDRLRNVPVLIVLGAIWLFFDTRSDAYLSSQNLTNLVLQIVTTAILALGIVFVLLVGEIDLSSAILSGVCATVVANYAVTSGWNLYAALAVGVLLGMVAMLVQALIIVFGVPSLIVTLGGMVVFQGLLLVVLPPEFTVNVGGTDYAKIASEHLPTSLSFVLAVLILIAYAGSRWRDIIGSRSDRTWALVSIGVIGVAVLGGVTVLTRGNGLPFPVLILGVMLIVASYATTSTRYGVHLYAVGGDRDAAQRAGIPVYRMVLYSFLILGACAAIAGVVDASRQLAVSNSSGGGPLMLNAIAAAVVGGTSLFGGRGSVWSALLGALVIGSINNGVQLLGYSPEVQFFATGGVLVVAVAMDVVITRGSLWPRRA